MKRIYLFALLFAVLTGIAIFNYAHYLQNSMQTPKGLVVAALKKIPENTLITEDMIEQKKLPKEAIIPQAVTNPTLVVGRIANSTIEIGEQVLTTKLNEKGKGNGGLTYIIPKGQRAITVEVGSISGVAGNIKETNHVDVIASLMLDTVVNGKTEKVAKTVLLLQNKEVLKVGTLNSEKPAAGYTNITLAVTPQEAVKLFYAQTNGKLTVALRPILEEELSDTPPYMP